MRLIYEATGLPVALGDAITLHGSRYTVGYFRSPHKPSSEGKVVLHHLGNPRASAEFYVSIIGAKWIEREDRP